MCLGLSRLPKYPFQDHFLNHSGKALWTPFLWRAASFHRFRELCLIYAAARVLLRSISHAFERDELISWDAHGFAWTTAEKSPAEHLWNQSALIFHITCFSGQLRASRMKSHVDNCTSPSSPSWLAETPCDPSGSFSHWLCMCHCIWL